MDPREAAQHSGRVAAVFNRAADTYDSDFLGVPTFGPIAHALVAEVAPMPGETLAAGRAGSPSTPRPWSATSPGIHGP